MRFATLQNIKKALVKQYFEATGKVNKTPYKTCRLRRLLEPFVNFRPEKHQKALGFYSKFNAFLAFPKHQKTVSKTTFWSIQKSASKYLINLSNSDHSGAQNAKTPPK